MDDQRLWAPWRIGYITGQKAPTAGVEPRSWLDGADRGCFLCRAAATYDEPAARREHMVVAVSPASVTLLNRFPYNNGHLLVSPRRHVSQLHELTSEEHLDCMASLGRFTQLLKELSRADGFNIGLNLDRVAGAGVPGHLHWHLVPRWTGDNNFMPVIADTRIISQSLEALWEAINEAAGAQD